MIRLWLRVLILLVVVFAATVSAILAQPRDDAEMRAFFAPQSCQTPCFLGIQPGATTEPEARAILIAHPWVGTIRDNLDGFSWSWNGEQPGFVSGFSQNFLLGNVEVREGVVEAIHLQTTTSWASFFFLFGAPDQVVYLREAWPSAQYRVYDASYHRHDFEIETTTRCPITTREAAWYSIVYVTWPASGPILNSQRSVTRSC